MGTSEADNWFAYAENDFEAAIILSEQAKPKCEIVCYHCQQCAEKMLKGFIAGKGGKLLKTHDLVILCEACLTFNPDFDAILETCSDLTVYASGVRYPNSLEVDDYHMRKALMNTKRIIEFVRERI